MINTVRNNTHIETLQQRVGYLIKTSWLSYEKKLGNLPRKVGQLTIASWATHENKLGNFFHEVRQLIKKLTKSTYKYITKK